MTTNTAAFTDFLKRHRERVDNCLQEYLPATTLAPTALHNAMQYAVLNGGKRIRPLLVYATGLSFGATPESLDLPAAAMEFIHAYSLIHDDLPAMDDDDVRRGKPSCHKAFGETTAIITGDALQSLAFELLARDHAHLTYAQQVKMIHAVAKASGSLGMAGGQQLDMETKNRAITPDERDKIRGLKTGALFNASVTLGAIAANCSIDQLHLLNQFSSRIGLAFQIQDDLLDHDSMINTSAATSQLQSLFNASLKILESLGNSTVYLEGLCRMVVLTRE